VQLLIKSVLLAMVLHEHPPLAHDVV